MAEILPIRAWKYNPELSKQIEKLTSPLFDVVSPAQRKALYDNPNSSIHLSVPQEPNAAERAKKILNYWKQEKIIIQDDIPGIYVYYQYFTLPGYREEYYRKGFICNIKTYEWEENVVLRHENTMPASVEDRMKILEATEFHVSPTHGLYTDTDFQLDQFMEESIQHPIYESEDYQGVRNKVGVIHDFEVINRFIDVLKDKQVILADGHHRYAGSILYMQVMRNSNSRHTGQEGYNFHTIYLTNTEDNNVRILPTHRVIYNMDIDESEFLNTISEYFEIKEESDVFNLNEVILGKKWTFGLVFQDRAFQIRLKENAFSKLTWNFPEIIKSLDLTVLHFFIIEKGLKIPTVKQLASENIKYNRNFTDCVTQVMNKQSNMAIITNEITIEEVKNVCYSGSTLPPKSTYFYPKVTCGYVFSSIKDDEFELYPLAGI